MQYFSHSTFSALSNDTFTQACSFVTYYKRLTHVVAESETRASKVSDGQTTGDLPHRYTGLTWSPDAPMH